MQKHVTFLLLVVLVQFPVSIEADSALVLNHGFTLLFLLHFTSFCRCFMYIIS
ncbi:hypothetical protein I3760_06G074600 [Carya illinoinensis]|nr:hypothetical protein I3760_06G074600 [Carya illinoinensis]